MERTAESGSPESRAAKAFREIFESGRPLTYVRSSEEQRVAKVLREAGQRMSDSTPLPIWTWSLTEGMRGEGAVAAPDTLAPRGALEFIAAHKDPAIFHLKDFHEPMREFPEIRRRLRDLYELCLDQRKFVVISSAVRFVPEEVERDLVYLELRLPDTIELVDMMREEGQRLAAGGAKVEAGDATLNQLAHALQGLTLNEARHAVRRAVATGRGLGADSLAALLEEKRLLVNRSGVVEFIADATDIGAVGGLDNLKKWLLERRKLFQLRDSIHSDIVPKGLLMMGIPGCGKSLSVKAIASHFELPLYRIDMVEVFSGRHGHPEGAFVEACKMLEEMAPAVVWFDEIEMGITSAESGGEQGRIFAFFLTWMQEKTRGLFIAATANRIDLLPAEMIRKGRFDEVFFVDLPLEEERAEIFNIHLSRRSVDTSRFNIQRLAAFANGWTGAEIEQCVVSALTKAQLAEKEITEDDLLHAAADVVPLSRTMREQINHIRGWASERALRATRRPLGR
jgi:ATPase family associated with various cellular activities (AAA)